MPACWLAPLVAPEKVPPCAGRTIGAAHVPPLDGSVVVVVAEEPLGGVTVNAKLPCDVEYPSTTMK